MPYAMNLVLRMQIEWLCTYMTISKQVIEMIVGPGRSPVKSTLPVPVAPVPVAPVPMAPVAVARVPAAARKKVSCVGPADLKA